MVKLSSASLLTLPVLAASASWQEAGFPKVTTVCTVKSSGDEVVAAAMDNSLGFGYMYSNDAANSATFVENIGLMNMGTAISDDLTAISGIGGIFVGKTGSTEFTKAADIHVISQDIEAISGGGFAAVGQFSKGFTGGVNGLAVSFDYVNWELIDTGLEDGSESARYGAFPSKITWYVTGGAWPASESLSDSRVKKVTQKITVDLNKEQVYYKSTAKNLRENVSETGYTGAIAKTTDGGKTWSKVYTTNDFYFNQISCASENVCVGVGENGSEAYAVLTKDGGATWETAFTVGNAMSLVGAHMISEDEAWISGGTQIKRDLVGYYYHTTDGGKTWEESTGTGYAFDVYFNSEGTGYSATLNNGYSTISKYA